MKQKTDRLKTADFKIWKKFIQIIKRPSVARVLASAARKELGI